MQYIFIADNKYKACSYDGSHTSRSMSVTYRRGVQQESRQKSKNQQSNPSLSKLSFGWLLSLFFPRFFLDTSFNFPFRPYATFIPSRPPKTSLQPAATQHCITAVNALDSVLVSSQVQQDIADVNVGIPNATSQAAKVNNIGTWWSYQCIDNYWTIINSKLPYALLQK